MIKTLEAADHGRWDAFVRQSPAATFFHLSAWKTVIERSFGHRCHYLYAERDGAITGVLPLAHVKSPLFGNNLVSTPFCVYGGIVAADPDSHAALDGHAWRLAQTLGVDSLELRNLQRQHPDRPCKQLYVTFRKPLAPEVGQNLLAIPRKQRAMVRKGIDAGLVSTVDTDVERLYLAYSESVRNLGTPVFAKRYLRALKDAFKDQCDIVSIEHDGRLIASVMNFYFRDEVLPYYGGGTGLARELKGNDFMYWEVMRRAVEKGVRLFDFGRSKIGTGSYSFKKNWGFVPQPLFYEHQLVKARAMPDVNPMNPKYQLLIAAWKRLPLPLSQLIGPHLAKDLG